MPSAMPYCKIPMTLTVIPSKSLLRTSTPATPSHNRAAFIINIADCCFFSAMWCLPCELFLRDYGTAANSPADLKVLPSGKALGHSVHSV